VCTRRRGRLLQPARRVADQTQRRRSYNFRFELFVFDD